MYNNVFVLFLALLTGVVLRCHGLVQDLSQGIQPLLLLPLTLTHEDKLPLRGLHHNTTLPLIPSSMFWDMLHCRVAFGLLADENDS